MQANNKVGPDGSAPPPPSYTAGTQPAYGQPGAQQGAYGVPITGQPGVPGVPGGNQAPVVWMPKPSVPGCPPGLEYLTEIDQILVKQQIDMLELFTGWEQQNKYRLMNSMGQQVYYAKEESGACERQCCQANRSFTMHITDNAGMEVVRLQREFRCVRDSCWFACMDCCAHVIAIEAPVGVTVGYVKQKCSPCPPRFGILDADQNEVLSIEGPCCMIPCTDIEFKVISAKDGSEVGKVTKQWAGMMKEMFTQADNFGISFPMDLDDFMYFEQRPTTTATIEPDDVIRELVRT
ncbi:PLS2-like protein [Mya arenaria]|uniref:Phospholipid scramblase n=1 Tax=Mya arenaria TaxID=6604 RepID=A0ABY7D9E8_MYAAR|nr:PLS2-like protein [Mya arenaria]